MGGSRRVSSSAQETLLSAESIPSNELRSRLVRGFGWNMLAVTTMQGSQIVFGIVLARLLTPHDYGLAAMALVFSSLVLALSDLSLSAGLVQRPHISEEDKSTVFWTSCAVGVLLAACGFGLSGVLAKFYGQPAVQPLFAVASLSFLFVSLQTTQAALLQRAMNFRAMNLRVMLATLISGVVGISAAAAGWGPWALIVQQVALGLVGAILLWHFSRWRPQLTYSLESLRDLGSFGLGLLGSRVLGYFNRNSDNILIGRFIGAAGLGAYSVAYNIMLLPFTRLTMPIQDTLFPALARMQDDRLRLANVWLRINRLVGAVVIPSTLGLIVVAPDLVDVLLGKRWHEATPVLQVLAPVGLWQSLTGLGGRVLTALGQTRTLFSYSVLTLVTSFPAFVIGLHWGIVGVAACYAIVNLPVQLAFARRASAAVDISLGTFLQNLWSVTQASLMMIFAAGLVRLLLVDAGIPPPVRLILVIFVGVAVYVPSLAWRAPEVIAELRSLRRSRAAGQPAVTQA